MPKKIPKSVSAYMAEIGARGGKKGRGRAKKRAPEHYKKLAEKRVPVKDET